MRRATLSNSFAKGCLDPHLSERTDLAHYHQSLADGENCLIAPQGGVADRGGTTLCNDADVIAAGYARRLRRRLQPIALTAGMINAGNGGLAANVVDQNDVTALTTSPITTTPWTLIDINLGVPRRVDAVDVINIKVSALGINETLAVEYWNGASWQPFGGSLDTPHRKHIRVENRTRRFAGWPGQSVTAQMWRISFHGAVGAGAVSLAHLRMWTETAHVSPRRLWTMARSADETYDLVLTDRNLDIFQGMRWQASIAVDIAAAQVDQVSAEASLDTLLLFHEDVPPVQVVRQGSAGEWQASRIVWTNVPDLQTTTAFSGSQDEIQIVDLAGVTAGQTVIAHLGGMIAAGFAFSTAAAVPAALSAALGTLPDVTAADVVVTPLDGLRFRVTFQDLNGSRAWPLLSLIIVDGPVLPATVVAQRGLDNGAGAKLWSDRTGWPRCGAFVQSRLLIAGFRAAPTSWGCSKVSDFYNFLPLADPPTADRAFIRALDVDEIETIHEVYVGRHIQLFTESGEWFLEGRTLDATQVTNAVLATRNGIAPSVPPVFADGATLFVQKGGRTLRDFMFSDAEQSYKADPLNVLGPHLLTDVIDIAHRTARTVREGNQILMVNADGTAALLTLLRSQDVIAIAPWSTPFGAFRRAACDINHNLRLISERDGDLYLETWTPEMPLDGATTVVGTAITTVGNLPFADGRIVWAYADDELIGPLTVASRAITLPGPASRVTVGIAPPFRARLPVVRGKPNEGQPFKPPMRIYEVDMALDATGDITVSVNGGAHQVVPLLRTNARFLDGGPLQTATSGQPDLPLLQRLFTGNRRVTGLTGWTQFPFVELSRAVPAPVRIKSVRLEIAHHG